MIGKRKKTFGLFVVFLVAVILFLGACSNDQPQPATPTPAQPTPAAPAETPAPTPEATPEPTPEPEPEGLNLRTFEPILLSGNGATVTEVIEVPLPLAVVTLTHDGSRNFIVRQYDANFDRSSGLKNEIGVYVGSALLDTSRSDGLVAFEVRADGNWTIEITPIIEVEDAIFFEGSGALVTGAFAAPANGPWRFTHDGSRNFIVRLYSSRGERGVINEIGVFDGTTVVNFGDSFAFWIVRADGNWTMEPAG